MAIELTNVRTGEKRVLSDPHQIGAFINSSDLHVNSNLGQDFGWRLAPSIIRRIEVMRNDSRKIDEIARRTGMDINDVNTIHLVSEISREDAMAERDRKMAEQSGNNYQAEYEKELEKLRLADQPKEEKPEPTAKVTEKTEPASSTEPNTTKKLK